MFNGKALNFDYYVSETTNTLDVWESNENESGYLFEFSIPLEKFYSWIENNYDTEIEFIDYKIRTLENDGLSHFKVSPEEYFQKCEESERLEIIKNVLINIIGAI